MSTIYRDATVLPRAITNRNIATYNRFAKYWPTMYVEDENGDDVKVYKDRARNFYLGDDYIATESNKRFAKAMGVSWSTLTSQDIDEEIDSLFFKMKNFSDTKLVTPSKKRIVSNIYVGLDEGDEFTVTVEYGGSLKKYVKDHSLKYNITDSGLTTEPLNTEKIRQVIFSNPWYYIGNSSHVGYSTDGTYDFDLYDGSTDELNARVKGNAYTDNIPAVDTSSDSRVGILALLDDGTSFKQLGIKSEQISTSITGAVAYRFQVKYKFLGTNDSSYVVSSVLSWCNYFYRAQKYDGDILLAPNIQIDTKLKRECYSMMIDETLNLDSPKVVSDSLFVKVPKLVGTARNQRTEYTSYLKVETLAAMKKTNAVAIIASLLDTGYSIEAKEWWEDILAAAIVILAIIVAAFVCSTGVGCAASPAILSAALGWAAITITVGMYLLSETGGLSSLDNVKLLGKFATIVGYASMFLGITTFINNIAQKSVEEGIKKGATKAVEKTVIDKILDTVVEVVSQAIDYITDGLVSTIEKIYTMFTQPSMVATSQVVGAIMDVVKVALKGFEYYMDQEKKKLDELQAELEAEEAAYNEEILNRPYRLGANVYIIVEARLKGVDMLNDMSAMKENMVGKDKNYQAWLTDVNS